MMYIVVVIVEIAGKQVSYGQNCAETVGYCCCWRGVAFIRESRDVFGWDGRRHHMIAE